MMNGLKFNNIIGSQLFLLGIVIGLIFSQFEISINLLAGSAVAVAVTVSCITVIFWKRNKVFDKILKGFDV